MDDLFFFASLLKRQLMPTEFYFVANYGQVAVGQTFFGGGYIIWNVKALD